MCVCMYGTCVYIYIRLIIYECVYVCIYVCVSVYIVYINYRFHFLFVVQ